MNTDKLIADISKVITDNIISYNNHELYEMALVGQFNKLYIVIWTNDPGWIPHFHIFNSQNPKKATFDACVKIETAEYFKHGHHTDILSKKQIKLLIEFLKSEYRPGTTNWQHIIDDWNSNNSKQTIPWDTPMPDYTKL